MDMSERLDTLSCLPVPLLHHLLSFLPTQDVVRTCVLSKNWRKIWCSVPTLNFSANNSQVSAFGSPANSQVSAFCSNSFDRGSSFVRFVDSFYEMLLVYTSFASPGLIRLMVSKSMCGSDMHLRIMLKFLILTVYLTLTHIFTCKSLRECKLSCTRVNLPASICLPSLRVLHLENVDISDGQLDEPFFSAIPSLETFILFHRDHSYGLMSRPLTISSHQLRNFKIVGYFPYSIEITAPNLVTFKLKFDVSVRSTFRSNCDAMYLSDAIADFKANSSESMAQLIGIVKNARRLELSFCSLLAFEELQRDISIQSCFQNPFSNLKWLKIATCFGEDEILLINNMLEHSPEIETIIFANEMKQDKKIHVNPVEHSKSKQVWDKHKFIHLKLVKIQDFNGSVNGIKMLRFFLENAVVLEKLIVEVARYSIDNKKIAELGSELLAYPRASSSVGILFL